jgi:hypothetical protein
LFGRIVTSNQEHLLYLIVFLSAFLLTNSLQTRSVNYWSLFLSSVCIYGTFLNWNVLGGKILLRSWNIIFLGQQLWKKNVFANNQHLIEAFEITLFRIQFLLPKSKKKVLSKLFFLLSLRKVGNNSWVINYWEPLAFCCLNDFVASLNLMKRKLLFKFIFFLKIKKTTFCTTKIVITKFNGSFPVVNASTGLNYLALQSIHSSSSLNVTT